MQGMVTLKFESLILYASNEYGIDPKWFQAIISQESNWDICALRYESGYQWLYDTEECAKRSKVTLATEIACQKMSWGLGQIMGALAREQGLMGSLVMMIQPEINIEHMGIRLKHLKNLSQEPSDVFAMYNGGPSARRKNNGVYLNQSYVDKVMEKLSSLL